MQTFFAGLALAVVGLVSAFFGYRLFRILLPIYGAITGFVFAWGWLGSDQWLLALIVGVGLGLILGILAYGIWSVLVGVSGAILGLALAALISSSLSLWTWLAVVLAVVFAVGFGLLFVKIRNEMVIVLTAVVGASAVARGIGQWLGVSGQFDATNPVPVLLILVMAAILVAVAILGIRYQWGRYLKLNLYGKKAPAQQAQPAPAATRAAAEVPVAQAAVVAGAAAAGVAVAEQQPAAAVEEPVVEAPVAEAAVVAGAVAAVEEERTEAPAEEPAAVIEAPVVEAPVAKAAVAAGAVAAAEEERAEAPAEEPAAVIEAPVVEAPVAKAAVAAGAVAAAEEARAEAPAEEPAAVIEEPVVEAPVAEAAVVAGAVAAADERTEAPAEDPVVEAPVAEAAVEAAVVAAAADNKLTETIPSDEAAPAADDANMNVVEEVVKQIEETYSLDDIAKFKEKLEYVEGIGAAYAEKLRGAGLNTVLDLLQRGATRKGRAELVEVTGITGKLILKWVNHADLYRIKGVGSEYADLLEAAGVDTVVELAHRNPANLLSAVVETNKVKNLVRKEPVASQVEDWVSQAKTLPRMIQY